MLPSPRTSLSSFRDYYENTSQNSTILNRNQGDISIGFRNFQVLKMLERMEKKIVEKEYWNKFTCFKKMNFKLKKSQRRMFANSTLKTIMIKNNVLGSKLTAKGQIMKNWLQNIRFYRERQKEVILKLGLFFSKRYYSNISNCFQKITLKPPKEEKIKDKDKTRYIKKLSKALLSIVFRNMMHLKFKRLFQMIKQYDNPSDNKIQHIRFFKPKKERLIYQHKIDTKINKLSNAIKILKLIEKKINRNKSVFWYQFKNLYQQPQINIKQYTGDSLDIMTNVVRHMIFLTGKENQKSLKDKTVKDLKFKGLKLKFLWLRIQSSKRRQITKYLMKWKQNIYEEQVILQKQIVRLQQIKSQFLQDL